MPKKTTSVERAISEMGGPTKAATTLGISNPSVVLNWIARGQVPAHRVLDVEKASGISRHALRPDVFGEMPDGEQAA